MSNAADARRRWWGVFFLALAAALLIWGETLLKEYLIQSRIVFILYWFACFASIILAIFTALLDIWATRRRFRSEQKDLIKQTLLDLEKDSNKNTNTKSGN